MFPLWIPPACILPPFHLAHLPYPLLMQHSCPTFAFKPLTLLSPTSYLLPLYPHPFMFRAVFLYLRLPLPPLTYSGFYNEMLEIFEPRVLSYYTLSRAILLTLSASRNLTLIHLPLSVFLDSLLCDLIALTPDLAFFLPMNHMLAPASSFSSGRAYLSLNFLPPLFLFA